MKLKHTVTHHLFTKKHVYHRSLELGAFETDFIIKVCVKIILKHFNCVFFNDFFKIHKKEEFSVLHNFVVSLHLYDTCSTNVLSDICNIKIVIYL